MNFKRIYEIVEDKKFNANAPAWWISPYGEIISVDKGNTHIGMVFDDPSAFGLDDDYLHKLYDEYKEPYRSEGVAREKIILDLTKQGWIRIRNYRSYYAITLNKISKRVKDYLYLWAVEMKKWDGPSVQVKIDSEYGVKIFTIGDIANDVLYSLNENTKKRYKLIPIDSVKDFKRLLT
jgi:hypothetical protein